MEINIQSVKFTADRKLLTLIENKIQKFDRFNSDIIKAEVILKLDKDSVEGNKVITLRILVPSHELVAERRSKTFEEAIDLVSDSMKNQMEKLKDK